ncbi:MAG: hypothetical protein FJY76_01615 [Candidatus Aenigmarchaeota archaeon]|nr:hypothetical protein [Candidatus Aenigmarchaeota archaeon]
MFLGLDPSTLNFLLPFLLMLAIVYGALQMASPIKNKGANFIIALVFALFAATYQPAVDMINQLLPYAVVLFVVVFLLGFVWKGAKDKKVDFTLLAIVAGLIAIFLASPMGQDLFGMAPTSGPLSADNLAAAAGLLFVLIMLVVAYKSWGEDTKGLHEVKTGK